MTTSSLALIEVMTTLVRKERAGELATDDMDMSLNLVEADYDRFATVPLSNGVTDRARTLSRRYGLRGADTIHLAAAQWVAEQPAFHDDPFGLITAPPIANWPKRPSTRVSTFSTQPGSRSQRPERSDRPERSAR